MADAARGGSVEAVAADVLLLFHPEDEPAPRGRLGRVDWLLCGAVSRLRARGKFRGERDGRALLSSAGKLRSERVLVLGLGPLGALKLPALYHLSYEAAQAVLQLGGASVAVEVPCRGFPGEDPERIRAAFLEGFLAELRRGGADPPVQVTVLR